MLDTHIPERKYVPIKTDTVNIGSMCGLSPHHIHAVAMFSQHRITGNLVMVTSCYRLDDVSRFYRNVTKDAINATLRIVAERTEQKDQTDDYSCYKYNDFKCLVKTIDRKTVCVLTGEQYNDRVGLKFLRDITSYVVDPVNGLNEIKQYMSKQLSKYQDPGQIDKICQINQAIDQTKEIMIKNIDSILERGEQIESMVERSDELSKNSKAFFKSARRLNRKCCTIM